MIGLLRSSKFLWRPSWRARHILTVAGLLASSLLLFYVQILGSLESSAQGQTFPSQKLPHHNYGPQQHPPNRSVDEPSGIPGEPNEASELARLLDLCHKGDNYMITRKSHHNGSNMEQLFLGHCFPLEIMTSQGARSIGHCTDFVLYIYHAGARLSPAFSDAVLRKSAEKCPRSVRLHGEFPVTQFFEIPGIKNYWMPNVEQIRKEQSGIVMLTTQFLAKTQFAHTVLTKYLSLRHLQRIPVRYVGHTSLDPLYMGGNTSTVEMPRDFRRFFHAYGHSGLKSTRALLRCWKTHPEWPTLTVVGMNVTQHKDSFDDLWVPDNVEMKEWVDLAELRRLQRTHSMHLCPSVREGFGHYINEGRGVGALVITTDFGPMNEIVDYGRTGILIQHVGEVSELHQLIPTLGVNVQVNVDSERICEAVAEALEMPLTERERMGDTARTGYERDQALMRLRIRDLKVEVVREFFGKKSMSSEQVDAELMRIELPLIDRQ